MRYFTRWLLAGLILVLIASGLVMAEAFKAQPEAIVLEKGYKIESVVTNLSVPTTAIFDGEDLIIAESGFLDTAKPRLIKVKKDGTSSVIASNGLEGPVTGLLVKDGQILVSHRGKVSIVQSDGSLKDIVDGLPSKGDHHNNNIVLGPDGKIYLGQGTTTNSAVVGEDNYIFGWLEDSPQLHETPCKDVTLVGRNFETENPLTDENDKVTTGAYKPFGTASQEGEVIKGSPKCGGSIIRLNPDGSDLELFAYGLRNPFGLEFDKSGQLWATNHGADVRGSRNIYNDPDYLINVKQDAWYGWPDFFAGKPVTDSQFDSPTDEKPQFLWKDHPDLTQPFVMFDTHSGINGIAFSPDDNFGFAGDAFIAMFGSFAPVTSDINIKLYGYRVARVNMRTKEVADFAGNKVPGPSYINRQGGFNRPSDVVFGPDDGLYVVDWGASTIGTEGLKYVPESGSVWRIYPENAQALRPAGPVIVASAANPEDERKANVKNVPALYKSIVATFSPFVIILLIIIGAVVALAILMNRKNNKTIKK